MPPRKAKKTILLAIKDSGGIVSTIAKRLECSWSTAKIYIEKFPVTLIAYDDEKQKILDVAESGIYSSITRKEDPDYGNMKWILERLGKDRGFSTKQEIDHSGSVTIVDDIPRTPKPPVSPEDENTEQETD